LKSKHRDYETLMAPRFGYYAGASENVVFWTRTPLRKTRVPNAISRVLRWIDPLETSGRSPVRRTSMVGKLYAESENRTRDTRFSRQVRATLPALVRGKHRLRRDRCGAKRQSPGCQMVVNTLRCHRTTAGPKAVTHLRAHATGNQELPMTLALYQRLHG